MRFRSASRPQTRQIAKDRITLQAIKGLPDYAPANAAYSVAMLAEAEAVLNSAEERVSSLTGALAQARAELDMATYGFHEGIIAAKAQVVAQYGNDSAAMQAIGFKRRSARRRPSRRGGNEA